MTAGCHLTASDRETIAITVPKLPYLSWRTFGGDCASGLPCVADLPNRLLVSSGRVATAIALRLAGAGAGTKVLVPSYHCPTMVAAVVATGAEPVFFPMDHDGSPSLDFLEAQVLDDVRAMVAVHYFGLPVTMTALRAMCDRRGIALIEDCAHSMFGIVDGSAVGTTGDYAIASLTKFFPVVDGGIIARNAIVRRESSPTLTLRWQPRRAGAEIRSLANALELGVAQHGFPGLTSILRALFGLRKIVPNERDPNSVRTCRRPDCVNRRLPSGWPTSPAWRAEYGERALPARGSEGTQTARGSSSGAARTMRDCWISQPTCPVRAPSSPRCRQQQRRMFSLSTSMSPRRSTKMSAKRESRVHRWDELWPGVPVIPGDYGLDWAATCLPVGLPSRPERIRRQTDGRSAAVILARRRR